MKKIITMLILLLACVLVLSGCGCKHETWLEADCVTAKTCAECGETEGEPLGHVWMAATCTDPKTCESCALTEGEAKGHNWLVATCTDPETCERCKLTEGEALGHTWVDATTEAPKTCTTCSATEGERIITDPRFTTASAAPILGKWGCRMNFSGEEMGLPDFPSEIQCMVTLTFGNAGELSMGFEMVNEEAFMDYLVQYLADTMYAEFSAQGIDETTANTAMQAEYGMTVEEYAAASLEGFDMNELFASVFSAVNLNSVYYVEGDQLYAGNGWDLEMTPTPFSVDGDTLYINELTDELGLEPGLTRLED